MQQNLAKQNYLQAEVQTATPQKLQLMLVEAAIKNIHRTKKAWEEEKFETGFESLSLAQDIIAEVLSSVDKEGNAELAGKIASIYVFIFRCLAEGGMSHDPQKLDDALRVLTSERETWRLVCEKFGSSLTGESSARLDLSTDSSVKSPSGVIPPSAVTPPSAVKPPAATIPKPGAGKPSGISTATFGKPSGFGSGVKPIGTSSSASTTSSAQDSSTGSGVSWDV
jgi:flagellar protein FliS